MRIKISRVVLFILLCSIIPLGNDIVKGNELLESENKLKYIEGALKETEMSIKKLNDEASYLSKEIKNVDGLIVETETEIREIERNIANKEKELERIEGNKSVLASNLNEAKGKFEEITKHLKAEGEDYLDYVLNATDTHSLNQRINELKMAYEIYHNAVEKYENDLIYEQAKEGTIILEKEKLEKDKQVVLNKKAFVRDQLDKKNNLFSNLMSEKEQQENAHSELENASKELENIIVELQRKAEESNSYTVIRKGGKFQWPSAASDRVTSGYGKRTHPITGEKGKMHNGVDIGAKSGTDVLAAENGVVIHSGWINGYGNTIIIDHGEDLSTLYAHNSKLSVKSGQEIKRGQVIAKVGSTGNSTGPHIHFEVRISGTPVNPMPYLQ